MKIFIKARPNSKEELIKKIDENHFLVRVKEPPIQGRANRAIISLVAKYFGLAPTQVIIVSGFTAKNKIIELT